MESMLEKPLFDGTLVRLGPIDHDKDAEIESRWTHDASFMRMMYPEPMRPITPAQVKKQYEALEKEIDEKRNMFSFRIRAREDDRLVGLAEILWLEWNNGNAFIRLGIGQPDDRHKGYGRETLGMLLHFVFRELNLYRVAAIIPEYNQAARQLFEQFGFVEEVRRREGLNRDGRRWDLLTYGLLVDEWRNPPQNATKGE